MPRRIIIHAGFHKTGTTTIQATLRENRVALKKQIALRLRWHMKDIVTAARGYSIDLDPLTLVKLQSRFGGMVNELPGMPRRTLIISAEELSGHLPGRGGLADYGAAPVLLYAYWEILRALSGGGNHNLFVHPHARNLVEIGLLGTCKIFRHDAGF